MSSPAPIAARARRAWTIALAAMLAALILPAAAHAAPGWTAPQQLPDSTVASSISGAPDVKVDRAGNAVAVWGEGSFPSFTVKAATKPAGGAWSAPSALVAEIADTPLNGNSPSVTVAPDGSATAVWKDSAIMSTGIWVATRAAGGSWGDAFNVSASAGTPTPISTAPRAVTDAAGNTTVLWQSGLSTLAATRPAGGDWGAPVDVFTTTSEDSNNLFGLAVDVAADGAVTAVFRVGKTSNFGIYAKTRATPTGPWSSLQEILGRGNTVNELQVAISGAGSSSGEATVMWRDNSSVVKTSSRSATGSTWSAPADVGSGTGPRVAYDRHGNAVAAWQGTAAIQTMRRVGGAWSAAAALPGADGGTAPQVVTGPDGEVHAAWNASDGTAPVVHSARFAGGAWSTPAALSDAGVATGATGLAIGPIGDVDALWPVTGGDVRGATFGNERELGTDWTANGLPGSFDLRSWIRYIGGNVNVTPSEGATRPDDNDPYSFRFGHTDAWIQAETGETVVAGDGQVRFAYTSHFIDNRVVDPQFRIDADGRSGRVIADGQGSGDMAEAMNGNWQVDPYRNVHLLDLDVDAGTRVVSADGQRIAWVGVPAYIAADGERYLSYAAGTRYGFFTITAPAALEERAREHVEPGPGPGTDPGPAPGPGTKVDPKPDKTTPKLLRATGKVTKTGKHGAVTVKLDKRPGKKASKTYRVKLVRKGKTVATGTVRSKTLKLNVRKTGKGKKARHPKLKGTYTLSPAKGVKGVTRTQLTVGRSA